MTDKDRSRNRALLNYILLPVIFLTVALLGGLRIDLETKAFVFVPPPLITLILSALLMILFVRGHTIEFKRWVRSDLPPITNLSHVLTLLTLFFGSAQAFNSVLPEHGFLFWLFSFFFVWTLWNNQFSSFDARGLLKSLAVLFATAFFLKHMFLASLYSPGGGWAKKIAGFFLDLGTLGTLDTNVFAPATGYISFFTLGLYILGLILLMPTPDPEREARALIGAYRSLPSLEQATVREAIAGAERGARTIESGETPINYETVEITGEIITEKEK